VNKDKRRQTSQAAAVTSGAVSGVNAGRSAAPTWHTEHKTDMWYVTVRSQL